MAKDYTQTRRDRRDESRGMKRYERSAKGEKAMLRDNTQAPNVYPIKTDTEKYDLDRMQYHSDGMKGYAPQAFDYEY